MSDVYESQLIELGAQQFFQDEHFVSRFIKINLKVQNI